MRNLILFLIRNYAVFLFLILEATGFLLTYNQNHYQRAFFVHSANSVAGGLFNTLDRTRDYFALRRINDSLLAENARLHNQLPGARQADTGKVYEIADTLFQQVYRYIPARVINNSTTQYDNYLTLDRGSKDGIRPGMGVAGPQGIVGVVKNVSWNFSNAVSVLHHRFRARARISRTGTTGTLTWEGPDARYAQLNEIGRFIQLKTGDTVVTSSYSTVFPENLLIGQIDSFYLPEGSDFYNVRVRLSTDFSSLEYVYVINYLFKTEQQELEEAGRNE